MEGETFSASGMIIEAQYSDKVWLPITNFKMGDGYNRALMVLDKSISVSYGEKDKYFETKIFINVLKKEFANSKIHQTNLHYGCGAGQASVNVYTGNLLFEHTDAVIGANGYQIGVKHIYKRGGFGLPASLKPCMGNKWKLNVQQYLLYQNGTYIYIDDMGLAHIFEELGAGEFYDTSGLGLIFDKKKNIISDQLGNKMYFSENVLVKTESCHNSAFAKCYEYKNEKLSAVYDSRNRSCKMTFKYNQSGLLEKINCEQDSVIVKTINYFYDTDNNLLEIKENADEKSKETALFEYVGSGGVLVRAIDGENRSALQFEYGSMSIHEVICGYADSKSVSSQIIMRSRNTFEYADNYTTVENEKNVKLVYYFNANGLTVSVLEAAFGSIQDLRTLEKEPGVLVWDERDGSEKINGKNSYSLNSNSKKFSDLQAVSEYRGGKCADYKYYTCSFWLKLRKQTTDNTVSIKVVSGKFVTSEDTGVATYDGAAAGSWQLVTVPLWIKRETVKSIEIKLGSEDNEIADVRLCYSPRMKICIGTPNGTNVSLDEIRQIKIKAPGTTKYAVKNVNKDCYMSEKDLQATYMSLRNAKDGAYILSLCDNTLKYRVTEACLNDGRKDFVFGFENGRAKFYQETISPDDEMHVYSEVNFNSSNEICQFTRAKSREIETETCVYIDGQGKVLKETDEYGVETTYDYDGFGNVTQKTVSCQGMDEIFVFEATSSESIRTERSATGSTITTFEKLFGNVSEIRYQGGTQNGSPKLTTFSYDIYGNKLRSVTNGTGAQNNLSYDKNGRLSEAAESGKEYGYGFEYNGFGDLTKSYLVYQDDGEKARKLLTSKEIDYELGTLTDKKYRGSERDADETIVTLDKYGRTKTIEETSYDGQETQTTSFVRQDLSESEGVSEVTEMYDGFEQATYEYRYDDRNNLTGYEKRCLGQGQDYTIHKIGENEVYYTTPTGKTIDMTTRTFYDREKLMNPRVTEHTYGVTGSNGSMNATLIEYEYDVFGRLVKKHNHTAPSDVLRAQADVTTEIGYQKGTLLKTEIKTTQEGKAGLDDQIILNENSYDDRGRLKESLIVKIGEASGETLTKYEYDHEDRLLREEKNGEIREYYYNTDGSFAYETDGENRKSENTYNRFGQLTWVEQDGEFYRFQYDNQGNCTQYKSRERLEWERGNILKKYTNAEAETTYRSNSQGLRIEKIVGGKRTEYIYEGGKLLGENQYKAETEELSESIMYFYDGEGMIGFGDAVQQYIYVKDAQGNVISILNGRIEVAAYEYDGFGKCTITKDIGGIGRKNPIRWKSQYYDEESGLYYIGGRYYSPLMRQYISAKSSESILTNAGTIYGLNVYMLCLTNAVNMIYNEYTIEPNAELYYDSPSLMKWERFKRSWDSFFRSPIGIGITITIFAAATTLAILCPAFLPLYASAVAGTAMALGIGGMISGFRSQSVGNGFWDGFANYLNENWSQTLSIDMALAMVTFGISQAVAAIQRVSANKKLAKAAIAARDAKVAELRSTLKKEDLKDIAAVVGGYNKVTGNVAVGIKSFDGLLYCAEARVVEQLGGMQYIDDIVMTAAIRPSNLKIVPVCEYCQSVYSIKNFLAGTPFKKL